LKDKLTCSETEKSDINATIERQTAEINKYNNNNKLSHLKKDKQQQEFSLLKNN